MISPALLSNSFYATGLTFGGAGQGFGVNQTRTGLGNTAGTDGFETPDDIANLQSSDKAMELNGIMAQTNYQVGLALQDRFGMMRRRDMEQKRRMMEQGSIFV